MRYDGPVICRNFHNMNGRLIRRCGVRTSRWRFVFFAGMLGWFAPLHAADWPQLLGPDRNGCVEGTIADIWPAQGPRVVWSKSLGAGWAGPAVAAGKLIAFYRRGDKDVVEAIDARIGAPIWSFEYPAGYHDDFGFDEGPRAGPTSDGDRIYTHGAQGLLHCLSLADGKLLWRIDTAQELGSTKGFFGRVCAPLIVGPMLILQIGAVDRGAGIVGLDKMTGTVKWKATRHEAGYSSPIAATLNNVHYAFCFTRNGLVGLNPADGQVYFEMPWRSRQHASVNAATPLVSPDGTVFISASYNTGAAALKIDGGKPHVLWSGDEILSNHYATSIYHSGNLYGFDGRQEQGPELRCVELASGRVKWTTDGLGGGSLIRVGPRLLVLTDKGRLLQIAANPAGYQVIAQAEVLGAQTRANPAFAQGYWYGRDTQKLICLDLR